MAKRMRAAARPESAELLPRLERLFSAVLQQVRESPEFARRIERALQVEAAPPPDPRRPAVLDPFAVYETGWEVMLRQRLARLNVEELRDVIHEDRLDPTGKTVGKTRAESLIDWIVHAVMRRSQNSG